MFYCFFRACGKGFLASMGKDSKQFTLTLPVAISDAISANYKGGIHDFIRKAAAEKLARDFGLTVSPVLTRAGQGRRTDLERFRELEKKLAPYGGAWEIIRTGKGYEETAETIDALNKTLDALISACPAARKLQERSEKLREQVLAESRKLQEMIEQELKEDEAREQAAGDFPESGTEKEKLEWYSRVAKPLDLKKIEEQARLEKDVKEKRLEVYRLCREAVKAALDYAQRQAKKKR